MLYCYTMLIFGFVVWFYTDTSTSWETKAYTAFAAVAVLGALCVQIVHWWDETRRWYREALKENLHLAKNVKQLSADLEEAHCPRCAVELDGDYCERHLIEIQHL